MMKVFLFFSKSKKGHTENDDSENSRNSGSDDQEDEDNDDEEEDEDENGEEDEEDDDDGDDSDEEEEEAKILEKYKDSPEKEEEFENVLKGEELFHNSEVKRTVKTKKVDTFYQNLMEVKNVSSNINRIEDELTRIFPSFNSAEPYFKLKRFNDSSSNSTMGGQSHKQFGSSNSNNNVLMTNCTNGLYFDSMPRKDQANNQLFFDQDDNFQKRDNENINPNATSRTLNEIQKLRLEEENQMEEMLRMNERFKEQEEILKKRKEKWKRDEALNTNPYPKHYDETINHGEQNLDGSAKLWDKLNVQQAQGTWIGNNNKNDDQTFRKTQNTDKSSNTTNFDTGDLPPANQKYPTAPSNFSENKPLRDNKKEVGERKRIISQRNFNEFKKEYFVGIKNSPLDRDEVVNKFTRSKK